MTVLNEPENSLHPDLAKVLAMVIRRASTWWKKFEARTVARLVEIVTSSDNGCAY